MIGKKGRGKVKKSKVIHLTLVLFMIFSSFLMTIGTVVIDKTSKSMNQLFAIAKPPHFLQMHTGEINQKQIDDFTKNVITCVVSNNQKHMDNYMPRVAEIQNGLGGEINFEYFIDSPFLFKFP